jgi:hypothetical protein
MIRIHDGVEWFQIVKAYFVHKMPHADRFPLISDIKNRGLNQIRIHMNTKLLMLPLARRLF